MFAKTGPWTKRNTRLPVVRSSSSTSVPVMSDGMRSGVNWMRLKLRCSTSRQRADQQRLGQARHADQQRVAATEHRDHELLDHLGLAHDDPPELRGQRLVRLGQRADRGDIVGTLGNRWSGAGFAARATRRLRLELRPCLP